MGLQTDLTATLINRRQLQAWGIHYSNTHLIRLEREGKFPKRLRLSPCRVVWMADEIKAWLSGKAAERDTT